MKKLLLIFIISVLTSKSKSQDYIVKTIPIKDCKKQDDILNDSIFLKFITTLNLDISKHEVLYISDFVNYRDSLIINKIPFKISGFVIKYKNLDTFNIKHFISQYNQQSITVDVRKKIMSYRTTLPDDDQTYEIRLSMIN